MSKIGSSIEKTLGNNIGSSGRINTVSNIGSSMGSSIGSSVGSSYR